MRAEEREPELAEDTRLALAGLSDASRNYAYAPETIV
jgi:hypothetical protein